MTETTGDERVDAVVSSLDDVANLELGGQVAAFAEAHVRLVAVLDTEDDPPTDS